MSTVKATTILRGNCHCDRIGLAFSTGLEPATIHPRACDCSFCRKHGAAYISDSNGSLAIFQSATHSLREYRQGSDAARFLLCGYCGVLVAAIFKHTSGIYGAVNAGCLEENAGLGASVSASPQQLSPGERMARWLTLWIPNVALPTCAT